MSDYTHDKIQMIKASRCLTILLGKLGVGKVNSLFVKDRWDGGKYELPLGFHRFYYGASLAECKEHAESYLKRR